MKIDEAIEILSITLEVKGRLGKDTEHDAIQLGIEALKRVKELRRLDGISHQKPLPGEEV